MCAVCGTIQHPTPTNPDPESCSCVQRKLTAERALSLRRWCPFEALPSLFAIRVGCEMARSTRLSGALVRRQLRNAWLVLAPIKAAPSTTAIRSRSAGHVGRHDCSRSRRSGASRSSPPAADSKQVFGICRAACWQLASSDRCFACGACCVTSTHAQSTSAASPPRSSMRCTPCRLPGDNARTRDDDDDDDDEVMRMTTMMTTIRRLTRMPACLAHAEDERRSSVATD